MNHISQPHLIAKRAVDIFASFVLLIVLSPALFLITFLIWVEDKHSPFFLQERLGQNATVFTIYKFRTMRIDADEMLNDNGGAKGKNRITSIGRLLRATSIDELPQLMNILRGDMSLVGPRPVLPVHLLRYTEEQKGRFRAKPGVTGLSQINGRNTLKWSQRLRYDNQYIDNFSIWLDLEILFKTVKVVLLREGIVLDRNPEDVDDLAPVDVTAHTTQ